MPFRGLKDLLSLAAERDVPARIIVHPSGREINYRQLKSEAEHNSLLLASIDDFKKGSVVLIHFDDHLNNIIWFWSVLLADCIPAMSTPFSNNPVQRGKHLRHLHDLLIDPICLTRGNLLSQFDTDSGLKVHAVEKLAMKDNIVADSPWTNRALDSSDLALLMLTSGSTGNAKAVALNHQQLLASVQGKASVIELPLETTFMGWVGMDHVASMVEIHLHGLFVGANQVYAKASDLISDPIQFIKLIHQHRVSRTFAPNFFLANLCNSMLSNESQISDLHLDLSCLRNLTSGGEANVVKTCSKLSSLLGQYGAPQNVIIPGFGMTETCAGCIYNVQCPCYDEDQKYEFASLGTCVPGVQMRITSLSEPDQLADTNERGNLELSGPIIFKQYFNNPEATADAFTPDGWFRTGDQAMIDGVGHLNLAGRGKESINVNGIKYSPHELETALDEASITGLTPSYNVCFSYRARDVQTEQICVIYLPRYAGDNDKARMNTQTSIISTIMMTTGARPYVLPLDKSLLQKSTLGKLPRSKIRASFEQGIYKAYQDVNDECIKAFSASVCLPPSNETERLLLREFQEAIPPSVHGIGVETPIFNMGVSSIELISLKRRIEVALSISNIPIITLMSNPTVRSLACALQELNAPKRYDPVVTLQASGDKTPFWLFHPGVGEILVFLGLAGYLPDRPVHALRARGFNPSERPFSCIDEAVTTYHTAIKATQPIGPYALAGYSYGAMLAFETAKRLEATGDNVRFLGSFNLPPHIKTRMRQLHWTECLMHLSYFLALITEARSRELAAPAGLGTASREDALSAIIAEADPERLESLDLTPSQLARWADLAFALQSMAVDYDPSGVVPCLDIFYCTPLAVVASSRKQWLDEHLSHWAEFCKETPRFHEVEGEHYTMIGPQFVLGFQKTLRNALAERGL